MLSTAVGIFDKGVREATLWLRNSTSVDLQKYLYVKNHHSDCSYALL